MGNSIKINNKEKNKGHCFFIQAVAYDIYSHKTLSSCPQIGKVRWEKVWTTSMNIQEKNCHNHFLKKKKKIVIFLSVDIIILLAEQI